MSSKRIGAIVVIVIVLSVVGVLLPAMLYVRQHARQQEMVNRMKNTCLAAHLCHDVHKLLPPSYDKYGDIKFPASIHVHLLQFIEQNGHKQYVHGKGDPWMSIAAYSTSLDPSLEQTEGVQNFAANLRAFANSGVSTRFDADMPALKEVEPGDSSLNRTFTDGTSNTIGFATKYAECGSGGSWYAAPPNSRCAAFFGQNAARKPADAADSTATFQVAPTQADCLCQPLMAQSFSPTKLWVCTVDASVPAITPDVSAEFWNRALCPNDGPVPELGGW